MKELNVFQIILIVVFVVFAVVGVFFFAGFGGGGGNESAIGRVAIWGVVDERAMRDTIERLRLEREDFSGVSYEEKDERTFERDLVNALAAGNGPDLFLLSQDMILSHEDKVVIVPFDSFSERAFKDAFIEEGELYLREDGIIGFPVVIDPLVMYWNRDIFTDAGIASPPSFWDEVFVIAPKITQRDRASNIVRSTVAFGEFRNVTHAKNALSTLLIQAENPIVVRDEGGRAVSVLADNRGFATNPAEAVLRFYTEFSNPVKSVYSWNRALPSARQSFLAGDLAMYFGFASELGVLRQSNPNLNFDVAPIPQSRDASVVTTFGNMQALAIARGAENIGGAFQAAVILTGEGPVANLARSLGLPPVRRSLLRDRPADAIGSVFYDAALSSRGWLDPDPQATDAIFREMVESVVSGRLRLQEAVVTADRELVRLLIK